MAFQLAGDYNDVIQSIKRFNEELPRSEGLQELLGYFRAWYYSPELDQVGPSKFAGYKGMNAAEYLANNREEGGLDGTSTEPELAKWFDRLGDASPESLYVAGLVERLVSRYERWPNRASRFNAPRLWKQAGIAKPRPLAVSPAPRLEAAPADVADVFHRAFGSLSLEEQRAVAERLLAERPSRDEPLTALTSSEAPALAELWDNPADAAYDQLQ
ncbi:MAG: hypothetical protein HY683_05840 [Chloroflexi bacterium]|nr:hypothetical protein [Chloroflexota bacterium]